MLKKLAIAVVAVLAALVIVIAMQPATFQVQRAATIAAPPAIVFAHVNDFHKWEAWSPWAKLDPEMKTTYSGEPAGKGAVYAWTGNSEVGEGRMTILESQPGERVEIKLEFLKPFAATNIAVLAFKPEGDGTAVTWTMDGNNTFITKAVGLVMNMDKMIGADFEKGLATLKAVVEAEAKG